MLNTKKYIFFIVSIIILSDTAFAQIPSPLKDIKVRGSVMLDGANNIYTYSYLIFNPPINTGKVFLFEIDITKPLDSPELSSAGFVIQRGMNTQGEMMTRSFDEELARIGESMKKPVIPIGAQPPLMQTFPGWTADITVRGTVMWGGSEQSLISPNQSLGGFIVTSYALPGIREVKVRPDIDYDKLPEEYYENIELTKQLQDSLVYYTKTLGPTAPPADLKPVAFLDNIINMKHEAFSLGWIKNRGIEQSLDAKLDSAKKKLEQGNGNAAKNILGAFINEVEAQGCETYEGCPEGKHLTPEAYALLKYNVKYLVDNLR